MHIQNSENQTKKPLNTTILNIAGGLLDTICIAHVWHQGRFNSLSVATKLRRLALYSQRLFLSIYQYNKPILDLSEIY